MKFNAAQAFEGQIFANAASTSLLLMSLFHSVKSFRSVVVYCSFFPYSMILCPVGSASVFSLSGHTENVGSIIIVVLSCSTEAKI